MQLKKVVTSLITFTSITQHISIRAAFWGTSAQNTHQTHPSSVANVSKLATKKR